MAVRLALAISSPLVCSEKDEAMLRALGSKAPKAADHSQPGAAFKPQANGARAMEPGPQGKEICQQSE